MVKSKQGDTNGVKPAGGSGVHPDDMRPISRLPVVIHAQYIKDLSIENPHAPESLKAAAGRPEMEINFSMDARRIEEKDSPGLYEVTLGIEATAKRDDKVAFIVDLQYAVLVSLTDMTEEQIHPILMIEMPRYAFPFARQIISEATQQAGFAPLLLAPVDFKDFYMQRYSRQPGQAEAKSA